MNYLVYFSSAFNGTMLGILLDEAKKLIIEKKAHIYFVSCDEILNTCLVNPLGKNKVCKLCTKHTVNTVKKTLGKTNFTMLYKKDFLSNKAVPTFQYHNVEELKEIVYEEVQIGYASLSTHIHLTRNHEPQMDEKAKRYFDNFLTQAVHLTDIFQNILDYVKPIKVLTYNGRFNEFRPVFETALKNKVDVELLEVVRITDHRFFKVSFTNALPHAVKQNLWLVDKCWNNPELSAEQKITLAKSFFERRRTGQVAGDKVYTKNMKSGLLPENWNPEKRNIVIFNSSEDEFVAVGGEYVSLNLFKNQLEGLNAIFEKFKDDTEHHFYLRIHPNLTHIKFKYHTDLHKFQNKYPNVSIISGDSNINSYDLMDNAEKVIVFGSTMGIESAYWNKPVILLSCALYYYANFMYIPKDENELYQLIKEQLKPIYNENILKYGLYYIDKSAVIIDKKEQFKYVDYNAFKIRIFNKTLHGYNYQKMLGSAKCSALIIGSRRLFANYTSSSRFEIPE